MTIERNSTENGATAENLSLPNNLSYLLQKARRLILFGGKGGVGKTTAAAATAIQIAQSTYERILIISTDPAHSLSDSLNCPIGENVVPIPGFENLWGKELNANKLIQAFKDKFGGEMKKLAERSTFFDEQDIEQFFSLSLPGVDEVMAIIEVANLIKSEEFQVIILDTAPTGHTVKMLSLPQHMQKWVEVLDLMQSKHRYMAKRFSGHYIRDDADKFLETMAGDIQRVKKLLSDSQKTEFIPVMIPEIMSINETKRLVDHLEKSKVFVQTMIINRLSEKAECGFCTSRNELQVEGMKLIDECFGEFNLIRVPLFPTQIQGVDDLRKIGGILFGLPPEKPTFYPLSNVKPISQVGNKLPILSENPAKFFLFGGKGGVGKSSVASTAALTMARCNPKKKVLLFSTDPAHSLADSLDQHIGSSVTPVYFESSYQKPGETNLFAIEIDPGELFDKLKKDYAEAIDDMFDNFLRGQIDLKLDREIMGELISLSPPGLDEIMALKKVIDLEAKNAYDFFVLDTAPTGHLLRFLKIPHVVKDWLNTFFRLLIKYRGVSRLEKIYNKMLELSKSTRKIREVLSSPLLTSFFVLTIPEAMAILETERLIDELEELHIPCKNIIVNQRIPLTTCPFCTSKRQEQEYFCSLIAKKFPGQAIADLPMFPHEIRGLDSLTIMANTLFEKNWQDCIRCEEPQESNTAASSDGAS